jgi:hypothetical protein
MRHLLARDEVEAIEGDLFEQYRQGRSASWYWRQVLLSIGLHLISGPRHSPRRALEVVLLGNVFLYGLSVLFAIPMMIAGMPFRIHGETFAITSFIGGVPLLLTCFVSSAVAGRFIRRRWSPQQPGIFLLFAVSTFLTVAGVQISEDGGTAIAFGLGQAPLIYELARFSGLVWGGLRIRREQQVRRTPSNGPV